MKTLFSSEEIKKASKSMRDNRATDGADMAAEYVKYGSERLHQEIANILNKTAATGEYPKELRQGLLCPLPKPGK